MTEFDFDFEADLPSFIPGSPVVSLSLRNPNFTMTSVRPYDILGCIGYWTFDNVTGSTVPDYYGNNGTLVNGGLASGIIGSAGSFNGISGTNAQYVTIPFIDAYNLSGPMSMGGWIKIVSRDQWDRIFAHSPLTGATWPYTTYGLEMQGGNDSAPGTGRTEQVRFVLASAGSQHSVHTNAKPLVNNVGSWVHVMGVYGGGSDMRIYYNGEQDNVPGLIYQLPANKFVTGLQTGYIDTVTATDLSIARSSYNENYFGGLIDEVALFNRALTSSEVRSIYDFGRTSKIKIIVDNQFILNNPNSLNINVRG